MWGSTTLFQRAVLLSGASPHLRGFCGQSVSAIIDSGSPRSLVGPYICSLQCLASVSTIWARDSCVVANMEDEVTTMFFSDSWMLWTPWKE